MDKHTPGPWMLIERDYCNSPCIQRGIEGRIAVHGLSPAREDADARLISLSPEMLEALRHALDTLDKIDEDYNLLLACYERHHLRQIIAKATGETE